MHYTYIHKIQQQVANKQATLTVTVNGDNRRGQLGASCNALFPIWFREQEFDLGSRHGRQPGKRKQFRGSRLIYSVNKFNARLYKIRSWADLFSPCCVNGVR